MHHQILLYLSTSMSIFIAIIDIRFHRIPNLSIAAFTAVLFYQKNVSPPVHILFSLISVWVICVLCKVGMGDLKLLTVLLILQGQIILNSYTLLLFSSASAILLVVHLFVRRTFSGEIALAPAILIPFTVLNFAFYA